MKTARNSLGRQPGHVFGVLATLLLLGQPSIAHAVTYYVSTTGNNSNPGTQSLPWRTIQYAASRIVAGDTVLIRGGVYNERVAPTTSGTSTNRITYKSYPGETAILDGTGVAVPNWTALFHLSTVHYITLDGLEVRNSRVVGVGVYNNSTRIELLNLKVHNNGSVGYSSEAGIFLLILGTPAYTVIRGCEVYANYGGGIAFLEATGGYYLVENNRSYNNLGNSNFDGIGVVDTPYIVVRGNELSNNGQDYIDMGGNLPGSPSTHHMVAEDNLVWRTTGSTTFTGIKVNNRASRVIVRRNRTDNLGVAYQMYEQPFSRIAVYHNTFAGTAGNGLMLWNDDNSSAFGSVHVKNNVFAFATNFLIGFLPRTLDASGIVLSGNVYRFTSGTAFEWRHLGVSNPYYSSTLSEFNRWRSNSGQEPEGGRYSTQSLTQLFVDPANRNFALAPGSDGLDAGVPLTRTLSAGSGTSVTVAEPWYFFDGHGWLTPDTIQIGSGAPVQITSINDTTGVITLASSRTWNSGDPVSLAYTGCAPDAGALEFGAGQQTLTAPTNLRILPPHHP